MPLIFQFDFMLRAFAAGIIISVIAPLIGVFLVVKRYSLLADTLSHVSLVGIAGAALLKANPLIGALGASTIAAILMEKLRTSRNIFGESILSLFLSGSLAIAIILLGLNGGLNVNIFAYLFGSITTVTVSDLFITLGLGFVIVFLIAVFFKRFFIVAYDQDLAKSGGLPVDKLNLLLIIMAAATVSLSMRVVGILLVGALMVIPVVSSTQFGGSFLKTTIGAVCISFASVITGLFLSFYLDLPSGGSIVAVSLIIFAFSLLFSRK